MTVEAMGEPREPGEHLHRRNVQVRAFASPGRDDAVHLVGVRVHRRILEVKPPD